MIKNKQSKSLYIIFGVVIAVLLALIGYFAYLLIVPSDDANSNTNTTNATANSNANKNKNTNSNKNNSNSNANGNVNSNTNDEDAGLVEPDNSNSNSNSNDNTNSTDEDEEAEEVVAGEGEEVITLYFPKDGASCGEVSPVKRAVTPSEDLYGQIILATLAGPTSDESGYDNAASGIRLRWVEYTSEGSKIYVNEAYDELSDCDRETVDAQLIKTANVMFEVAANNDGEVVVGYPEGQDPNEEDTNDNSNTNDEE